MLSMPLTATSLMSTTRWGVPPGTAMRYTDGGAASVDRIEELAIMRPCRPSPISPVFYKSGPLLGLKVEDPDGVSYEVKSGVSYGQRQGCEVAAIR